MTNRISPARWRLHKKFCLTQAEFWDGMAAEATDATQWRRYRRDAENLRASAESAEIWAQCEEARLKQEAEDDLMEDA